MAPRPVINETLILPPFRFFAVAGAAAGDFAVTGIRVADRLLAVFGFDGAAALNITDEFTITDADTINNAGGTDTTGGILFVVYLDVPEDVDPI